MSDGVVKVCVRIPASRRDDLLRIAEEWRASAPAQRPLPVRTPGWDARAIRDIANKHFGGYQAMFEALGWPERGSDMMRRIQTRVRETFGSVEAFVAHYSR